MKNSKTGTFFTRIRQTLFRWRTDWKIFHRIFPQINQMKADNGYPFNSAEELEKLALNGELDAKLQLELFERRTSKMPRAYSEALRYIAYRDINARMKMYLEIGEQRVQPETCDPRFVAIHA